MVCHHRGGFTGGGAASRTRIGTVAAMARHRGPRGAMQGPQSVSWETLAGIAHRRATTAWVFANGVVPDHHTAKLSRLMPASNVTTGSVAPQALSFAADRLTSASLPKRPVPSGAVGWAYSDRCRRICLGADSREGASLAQCRIVLRAGPGPPPNNRTTNLAARWAGTSRLPRGSAAF